MTKRRLAGTTTLTHNIDQIVSAGSVLSAKGLLSRAGATPAGMTFRSRTLPSSTHVFRVARFTDTTRSRDESASLRLTVKSLQERVQALEEQLAPSVVVLREISTEDAKRELLDYFRQHPGAYPSDAATALRLDSGVVRDLSQELVEQGLLAG